MGKCKVKMRLAIVLEENKIIGCKKQGPANNDGAFFVSLQLNY